MLIEQTELKNILRPKKPIFTFNPTPSPANFQPIKIDIVVNMFN